MDNNKKEINENELGKINGGMKIIIMEKNKKFLEYFKKLVEKIKKK